MTKRKDISLEREKKQALWIERTMCATGLNQEDARALLTTSRSQSLRVNPLKASSDIMERFEYSTQVSWCNEGYELADGSRPDNELVSSGQVYIQNAASWLPVLALDPQPHDVILDVCAAPGGKASHIQAITNNASQLTCNDNSKPRLMKLKHNMERLGAQADYTLTDATRLSRAFELESFDRILVDAPCSGEGLMTLNDVKLFDSWSVAHIRRLSDLQKKILYESWQLLKPGGTLVYSTCTMAPEEDEAVIDSFLRKNPDARLVPLDFPLKNRIATLTSWNDRAFENDLSACLRLTPSKLTEAFFVAKLHKV